MIAVRSYRATDIAVWNALVVASRNATFLYNRSYMDYHSDRFTDASLIIERNGTPAALFVASRNGEEVVAHGGLTYGGLVLPMSGMDGADVLESLDIVADLYRQQGVRQLRYKTIPEIYCTNPSQEVEYALWRMGAQLTRCGLSSTVSLRQPAPFNDNARRQVKRAAREGVVIAETDDYAAFWQILSRVLAERHDVAPVHTLDEMLLLHSRFPGNIRLFGAFVEGEMLGGTVVYFSDRVAHAQYIAASETGRELRVLPLLFASVMEQYCIGLDYFDFGISTEQGGALLNRGLHHQKYGFGGRGVVYPEYRLSL